MTKNEIQTWLIDWFAENTSETRTDIAANISKNYFDLGWIDSIKFIQFLGDVEDDFDIEFSNDQFQDRDFATINGLTTIMDILLNGEKEIEVVEDLQSSNYTKEDIVKAIRRLGILGGDHVFIYSNVGFFGELVGAETDEDVFKIFKEAIREVIGMGGTMIFPTFSYSFCKGEEYDPLVTPSVCGLLSEFARQDPNFLRSNDANFSIAAEGMRAKFFTENMPSYSFGEDSFWERFLNEKGLFLNFNFDAGSTFIHYVERKLDVPYRWDKPFTGNLFVYSRGQEATFYHYVRDLDKPEHAPDFTKFDAAAKAAGIAWDVNLGRGKILAVTAEDTYKLIEKEIKNNPDFLIAGKTDKN